VQKVLRTKRKKEVPDKIKLRAAILHILPLRDGNYYKNTNDNIWAK